MALTNKKQGGLMFEWQGPVGDVGISMCKHESCSVENRQLLMLQRNLTHSFIERKNLSVHLGGGILEKSFCMGI